MGVNIINDVAGGTFDKEILKIVAEAQIPYICMHTRGTPITMNNNCKYNDIINDVTIEIDKLMVDCREAGILE
jgi:dihydropteroate synthase